MNGTMPWSWLGVIGLLVCAACAPQTDVRYERGDLLLDETFDQVYAWEHYDNPALGMRLRVASGEYQMFAQGGEYIWGLNATPHTDVVIEVDASHRSQTDNTTYGVICRAAPDNSGDGYYFLITADGFYSIRRQNGAGAQPLVPYAWGTNINAGRALNRFRVVCIQDYLALYINNTFVGEIRDTALQRGVAGFVVAGADENSDVEVAFDNLRIYAAALR